MLLEGKVPGLLDSAAPSEALFLLRWAEQGALEGVTALRVCSLQSLSY